MVLKLGTQTGSLSNYLYSTKSLTPELGMGATLLHWTDRDACTVIGWDGTFLTVQEDQATRTVESMGMREDQQYIYSPNPNGRTHTFKLTPKGWVKVVFNTETKRWNKVQNGGITVGVRRTYYDYSF